jgi:pimeloyl-ACP methyl ester carboxylesterase
MQAQDIILQGQRVHFWKGGKGHGILLLHSAWGDAEMSWSPVWDRLARSFSVLAPDLPGFGRSSPMPRPGFPSMAQVLKELIDSQHLDRVIVVGNSFGAGLAIQFAADHQEKVSHLVLVNGGYIPPLPGFMRKLIALPVVKQGFRLLMRKMAYSRAALKRSFVDRSRLPSAFFEKIEQNEPVYSRISFDTFMNSPMPLPKPVVPTLLLWGADDGLAPLKHAQALQDRMPAARLIAIQGAGHMPQIERPQEFLSAIIGLS